MRNGEYCLICLFKNCREETVMDGFNSEEEAISYAKNTYDIEENKFYVAKLKAIKKG